MNVINNETDNCNILPKLEMTSHTARDGKYMNGVKFTKRK